MTVTGLSPHTHELSAGVLVVGGGPAGRVGGAQGGAGGRGVVLADKGFCGTSGATAAAGTGVWYVPPDPAERVKAMASREALGGYLADRRWMARVLDQTYEERQRAGRHRGYPFPPDDDGRPAAMRPAGAGVHAADAHACCAGAGSRILDHSPVARAAGGRRRSGRGRGRLCGARRHGPDRVRAGRGGARHRRLRVPQPAPWARTCYTGDGSLMAAEAGRGVVRHGILQRLRARARRSPR